MTPLFTYIIVLKNFRFSACTFELKYCSDLNYFSYLSQKTHNSSKLSVPKKTMKGSLGKLFYQFHIYKWNSLEEFSYVLTLKLKIFYSSVDFFCEETLENIIHFWILNLWKCNLSKLHFYSFTTYKCLLLEYFSRYV